MKTEKVLLWAVIILLIGIMTFGRLPDSVGFPSGFYWQLTGDNINDEDVSNSERPVPIYAKDMIQITILDSRREIYYAGENATIDIEIYNPYNISYDLSVDWILNGSRYPGWEIKNSTYKILSSYLKLNKEGNWVANVLVKWEYENKTYDTDKNIEIEVLK